MNYELEAWRAAEAAGISSYTWRRYMERLGMLKRHHVGMYEHGLRVGLYAYGIATAEGWSDVTLPLMGGCGHDIGKCRVPVEVLDTTQPLGPAEWALLQRHPEDGHALLTDEFPLSAMVAGLHHAFAPRSYGIELTDAPPWLQASTAHKVIEATMVVMVADVFDAMTTRRNSATEVNPDDLEQVRTRLGELFGDWPNRVMWLADHRLNV